MPTIRGRVEYVKVGDDYGFVQIQEVGTGDLEIFIIWFSDSGPGGPAGFWEVMTEQPTTGSLLQVLNEDLDNGRVIYQSHAATDRSSVTRNRHNYYWKSAAFVTRKLRDVAEAGAAAVEGNALTDASCQRR